MTIENGYDLIEALKDGGRVSLGGPVLSGTFEVSGLMSAQKEAEILEMIHSSQRDRLDSEETRTCRLRKMEDGSEWFTIINPERSSEFVGMVSVEDHKRTCGDYPHHFTEV